MVCKTNIISTIVDSGIVHDLNTVCKTNIISTIVDIGDKTLGGLESVRLI